MFEHFKAHLEVLVTPDQRPMIIEAVEAIFEAGYERIDFILDQEMAVQDSLGVDLAFQVIENILRPMFESLFAEFGIEVSHDASLPYMTKLLRAVDGLDNYDDIEGLTAIAQADESSEEILARLTVEMSDGHVDDVLEHLISVKPALIERLRMYLQTAQGQEDDDNTIPLDVRLRCRDRLRVYFDTFKDATWLREQITDGMQFGMPFQTLCKLHEERLVKQWKSAPTIAMLDLLGLFMASGEETEAVQPTITGYIDAHTEDLNESTVMVGHFRRLAEQLARD